MCIQMLDEVILPVGCSCSVRTSALSAIYSQLSDTAKNSLRLMLQDRARIQNQILYYLQVGEPIPRDHRGGYVLVSPLRIFCT